MPTVSPVKNVSLRTPHEGSRFRPKNDSDDIRQAHKLAGKQREQGVDYGHAINQLARKVETMRRRMLGGSGSVISGWHKPRNGKYEVDESIFYDEGSVIHIQPTHSLVTTGIRDAANPTGGLITSCAGYWVAIQDVPGKTVVSGNDVWNLPQYPYPEPTDMDDPSNYWIYLGEMDC